MVDWSVYLVTEQRASAGRSTPDVVASALDGGVGVVQLRDKALPVRDRLAIGREVRELTRDAGVPLIVNDRVDLAQAIDADGVHLGDDDLPVEVAREMLGEDAIIGRSASFVEDAIAAEGTGADYLGVGSVYATDSKDDVPEDGARRRTRARACHRGRRLDSRRRHRRDHRRERRRGGGRRRGRRGHHLGDHDGRRSQSGGEGVARRRRRRSKQGVNYRGFARSEDVSIRYAPLTILRGSIACSCHSSYSIVPASVQRSRRRPRLFHDFRLCECLVGVCLEKGEGFRVRSSPTWDRRRRFRRIGPC